MTGPRFAKDDRLSFARPGPSNLPPILGTVIEVAPLVSGTAEKSGWAVIWRSDDGSYCNHPDDDPRLSVVA